jgi:hypothetical protein
VTKGIESQEQVLLRERERADALARDLAAARLEVEACSDLAAAVGFRHAGDVEILKLRLAEERERAARQLKQALAEERERAARQLQQPLEEERERVAALTRDLAAARQEARNVPVATAGSETTDVRAAGEAVARQQLGQALEEERERGVALTRELAAARREIEGRTALGQVAPDETVTVQLGRARKEERQRADLPAGKSAAFSSPTSTDTGIPERPVSPEAKVSAEAKKLLTRADLFFSYGDISAARILLERALETGSAEAGFRLAESYDPLVLSARRTFGTRSDAAKARELYSRAYEAGIQEAKDRIDALR